MAADRARQPGVELHFVEIRVIDGIQPQHVLLQT
jgi:hypothetical protein